MKQSSLCLQHTACLKLISTDCFVVLNVFENDGFLRYSIVKKNAEVILSEKDEHLSVYQNWFLYYDASNNLWVHSSDIGPFVYIHNNKDLYRRRDLIDLNDSLFKKIPKKFYDNLPQSFKEIFKEQKKKSIQQK